MWTDSSFCDVITTAAVAQQVVMRRLDESADFDPIENPLVAKIGFDQALQSFAGLIMHIDIVARLRAFSRWDFAGKWPNDEWKHPSHEVVTRNAAFDIDVQLAAIVAGGEFSLPAASGGDFLWSGMAREPRCGAAVIDPQSPRLDGELERVGNGYRFRPGTEHYIAEPAEMRNESPIPYSSAASQASAALLNSARAVRQAASVALDAGLAATIAATWTATRAELLARAQAAYPARGYT